MDRLIDADIYQQCLEEKAKKSKNLDTINGLCGAVAILYEQPTIDAIPKEQTNKMISEIRDSLDFWDYHNNNPLVRDILESVYKYCGKGEEEC